MSTSETYLQALLGKPSPAAQELLLTALESGRHPWIAGGLWDAVEDLTPSNRERYLTPTNVGAAYEERPQVAQSAHVLEHPNRRALQRAMLETLKRSVGRADRVAHGAGRDPLGKLQAGLLAGEVELELLVELHTWHPRSVVESNLVQRDDAERLLLAILERVRGTAGEGEVVPHLLEAVGAAEGRAELRDLHRQLLQSPHAGATLVKKPWLVTRQVLALHPSGDAVVGEVLEGLKVRNWVGAYAGLLNQEDPHVREVVTQGLEWAELERYAGAETIGALQRRVAEHVARELEGNPGAQEVLVGLADEWEGSVGGLVRTAQETSRRPRRAAGGEQPPPKE